MVNLRQHTHLPCNVGKLTGHKKKSFEQGTLLALFSVLYVDDGAFTFEDSNKITRDLTLIYHHFTRFGIEMHVGNGRKASRTECVFFPPPGVFGWKFNLPAKNSKGNRKRTMIVTKTRQLSYKARQIIEVIAYDNLPETRLIVVKDGYVTFCRHFKYLSSGISFSL